MEERGSSRIRGILQCAALPGNTISVRNGRLVLDGDSRDGRSFGFVERGAILGRAIGVYFRDGFTWVGL